jgi:hypothetical protein
VAGTRADHDAFCRADGWEPKLDARGRAGAGDHVRYRLRLSDQRVLNTKISRPVDRTTYGEDLWRTILREQLQVTEEQFWACVNEGTRPKREIPSEPNLAETIPANVVHVLKINGFTDAEITGLGRDGAIKRAQEIWSGGSGKSAT